ncbi:MAG TPA: hypothetical protein VGA70_03360 [Longimicrobiales bacterium]
MSDIPPPYRRRGLRILLAGGIQAALGILSLPYLVGLVVAAQRAQVLREPDAILILLLTLAQGLLDLTAGVLILRLRPAGWTLGVLMASFGSAFVLLSLGRGVGATLPALAGIALRVTVVILLALERERFRPPTKGTSPRG